MVVGFLLVAVCFAVDVWILRLIVLGLVGFNLYMSACCLVFRFELRFGGFVVCWFWVGSLLVLWSLLLAVLIWFNSVG